MEPLKPVYLAPLFRPLLAELLVLLRALSPADWERPTVAGDWRVRDVAAHLLDGDLRKIAAYRDGHLLPLSDPIETDADLARFINSLNATGVGYAARLSSRLITDLLEVTGGWTAGVIETLDPHARSLFAVSWAGEAESENWMDTGREYTERWHHQAQIRDAIGAPRLLEPTWFLPLLDMSIRVLPRTYGNVDAPSGTTVTLAVHRETHGAWSIVKGDAGWEVFSGAADRANATIQMASDDAWRLFYNALPADAVQSRVRIEGDPTLARPLLGARSVIL
jgi:hypothetical protein